MPKKLSAKQLIAQVAQATKIISRGNYVGGIGPSGAKIALVGEFPTAGEESKGVPFLGKVGSKLRELLKEANINYDDCYVTYVVKYHPPNNDLKLLYEIGVNLEESVKQLFTELRSLEPNLVIALGEHALNALTGKKGISKYRGSLLRAQYADFKVIATVHPSAIVKAENPWSQSEDTATKIQSQRFVTPEIVVCDFIKAKKEAATKEFEEPRRQIQIIKSASELYQFLRSYKDREPAIDIETYKCIPSCIAIAFTPWHIGVVPLMPIPGVGGELRLTETEYCHIWKELSIFLNDPEVTLIGQNIKFDLEKLISPAKLIHPFVRNKVAADTSMMMGVLYPELPRRLQFSTSIFTNEPFYKDEGKEFNPKKDPPERLLIYNGKDAGVTKEIKLALDRELESVRRADYIPKALKDGDKFTLKEFYYNYINKLTDFYMDMEAEGLDVDVAYRQTLITTYKDNYTRIHAENVALLGSEYNPRSYTKDIPKIVFGTLGLPQRKGTGEDELVALLGNHTDIGTKPYKVLRNILDERQVLTNYNYLEAAYDADGRMRSSWNPTGTETGRSSTSNLAPPLRPFDEKPHKIGLAFQTLPKHGPFSKAIRGIFIAPPGYVFLERDYSQAEARIVALLADDSETLELFDTTDIHSLTASWIFGGSLSSITSDQRFIGKTTRHAGNYGMGKKRLMLDANANALKFGINIKLSEKEAGEIIDIFHKRTPKIRSVFQSEVRYIVNKSRMLWNPYGRLRQFFGYIKDEEAFAQLPQSTVPDCLRIAGLRLKEKYPWLRFCLELHDAFVWKVKEDEVEKVLRITKEEMEVPISFKYCSIPRGELTIPTEASIGKRLNEMEKVKE
jgi:uracil-DNA glycosylase family 4